MTSRRRRLGRASPASGLLVAGGRGRLGLPGGRQVIRPRSAKLYLWQTGVAARGFPPFSPRLPLPAASRCGRQAAGGGVSDGNVGL